MNKNIILPIIKLIIFLLCLSSSIAALYFRYKPSTLISEESNVISEEESNGIYEEESNGVSEEESNIQEESNVIS